MDDDRFAEVAKDIVIFKATTGDYTFERIEGTDRVAV